MHLKLYAWLLLFHFFHFSLLTGASFSPTDDQEVATTHDEKAHEFASEDVYPTPYNDDYHLKYDLQWLHKMKERNKAHNKYIVYELKKLQWSYYLKTCLNVENKDFLLVQAINFLQTNQVAALIQKEAEMSLCIWCKRIAYFKLADYNKALARKASEEYDECKNSWVDKCNGKLIKLQYEIEERKRIDALFARAASNDAGIYTPTTFGSGR